MQTAPFVVSEKEELVLPDGAAGRATKAVIRAVRLVDAETVICPTVGIERIVVVVFVDRTVPVV
jgi:hypothetical protein